MMPSNRKFEYHVSHPIKNEFELSERLLEVGSQGWRLISILQREAGLIAIIENEYEDDAGVDGLSVLASKRRVTET
jgi:hypothetical protein